MSKQHAKMSRSQRAKQFAPFSALNGLTKTLEERERKRRIRIGEELTRSTEDLDDIEFADISVEDELFSDEYSYDPENDDLLAY